MTPALGALFVFTLQIGSGHARRQVAHVDLAKKIVQHVHQSSKRNVDEIDLDAISKPRRMCKAQDDLEAKYYPMETHGEHAIRMTIPGLPTVGDMHLVVDKIQFTEVDLEVKIARKDDSKFTFSVAGTNKKEKGTVKALYEGLDFRTPQSGLGGFGKGFSKFENVAANIFCFGQCDNYARVDQAKVDLGFSMSADFQANSEGKWQLVQGTEKQEVDIGVGSGGIVMSIVNKIISGAGGIPKLFFDNVWPLLQMVIPDFAGRAFQQVPFKQGGVDHTLSLTGTCQEPKERTCPSQELVWEISESTEVRMWPEPIVRNIYKPASEGFGLVDGSALKLMLGDIIKKYDRGQNPFIDWNTAAELTIQLNDKKEFTVTATPHIGVALSFIDTLAPVDLLSFVPKEGATSLVGGASIRNGVAKVPQMNIDRLTLPVLPDEGIEISATIADFEIEVESIDDPQATEVRYLPITKGEKELLRKEAGTPVYTFQRGRYCGELRSHEILKSTTPVECRDKCDNQPSCKSYEVISAKGGSDGFSDWCALRSEDDCGQDAQKHSNWDRYFKSGEANGLYRVLSENGVGHRRSKQMDDRDEGWLVFHDELVPGSDDGNGWLKCTIPKTPICEPKDKVHAVWAGNQKFYGATIRRIYENGTILVNWDDNHPKYRYVPAWQVTKGSEPCSSVGDFIFNKDTPLEVNAPGVDISLKSETDKFVLEPNGGGKTVSVSVESPFMKSMLDGIGRRLQLPGNERNGSKELADGIVPEEFTRPFAEKPALLDLAKVLHSISANIDFSVSSSVDRKNHDILTANAEMNLNGVLKLDSNFWRGLLRSKTSEQGYMYAVIPGLLGEVGDTTYKPAIARLSCGVVEAYYITDEAWKEDPTVVADLTKSSSNLDFLTGLKKGIKTRNGHYKCAPFGDFRFCGNENDLKRLQDGANLQVKRLKDVANRWKESCYPSLDGKEQVCPAKPDASWYLRPFHPLDRSTFFPGRQPPVLDAEIESPGMQWTTAKKQAQAMK